MTKIITTTDFDELWQKTSCESNSFEAIEQGNILDICNTYNWWADLRSGLSLWMHQVEFVDDLVWIHDSSDDSQFGLIFCLSGKVIIQRHGLTDKIDVSVGKYYLECNRDLKETEWRQAGEKLSRICLGIKPQQFFQSFGSEELEQIPNPLRQAAIGGKVQPYYQQGELTQQMWMVLGNILQCSYQGLMKRIYLESQAMELITLHFQQFQEQDIRARSFPVRKISDIDSTLR